MIGFAGGIPVTSDWPGREEIRLISLLALSVEAVHGKLLTKKKLINQSDMIPVMMFVVI